MQNLCDVWSKDVWRNDLIAALGRADDSTKFELELYKMSVGASRGSLNRFGTGFANSKMSTLGIGHGIALPFES